MPELIDEEEPTYKCPHCQHLIDELDYRANFSESTYGRSYGTYSFTGNEDIDEYADGDHECTDQESQDSDNWEEEDYTYFCPECEHEVDPADCIIRNKTEETEDTNIYKFKIGEEVIYHQQKNFAPEGETMEIRGKVTKRKYDNFNKENLYTIIFEVPTNYQQHIKSIKESKLEKIGADTSEWYFSINKNTSPMISSGGNQNHLPGTQICTQCNYAFIVNERSGQNDDMNECPQCNTIINQ